MSLEALIEQRLLSEFADAPDILPPPGLYDRIVEEVSRPLIRLTLAATRGNQVKAADVLGVNRNTPAQEDPGSRPRRRKTAQLTPKRHITVDLEQHRRHGLRMTEASPFIEQTRRNAERSISQRVARGAFGAGFAISAHRHRARGISDRHYARRQSDPAGQPDHAGGAGAEPRAHPLSSRRGGLAGVEAVRAGLQGRRRAAASALRRPVRPRGGAAGHHRGAVLRPPRHARHGELVLEPRPHRGGQRRHRGEILPERSGASGRPECRADGARPEPPRCGGHAGRPIACCSAPS